MSKLQFAARFSAGKVDAEKGVIYGVSLATVGPARGHGVMCDRTTLEQLRDCAAKYSGGLKVKMTHRGDAGDIVGALQNLRIEGNKLLGDLHLLNNYEKRAYVLEIAEKIPDTFGLSVAFSGPEEEKGGQLCARCTEIYSCDLVAEPAANPSGLFAARLDADAEASMTPEQIQAAVAPAVKAALDTALVELGGRFKAIEDQLKNFAAGSAVTELNTKLTELSTKLEGAKTEFATKLADNDRVIQLAAKSVATELTAKFGTAPLQVSPAGGGGDNRTEAEKQLAAYDEKLTKHFNATKSKTKAWSLAMGEDPKGHVAFINSKRKPSFEKAA